MADNFMFSGFPDNEEFEIPDKPSKNKSFNKGIEINLDLESLKSDPNVPDEIKNMLSNLDIGGFLNSLQNMSDEELDDALENMIAGLPSGNPAQQVFPPNFYGTANNNNKPLHNYELNNPDYLFSDEFGAIECISSENLLEEFTTKYGTDSTKYLDDNVGIQDFLLNDVTMYLNFDDIKNMRLVDSNTNFILFYMEPKNEDLYGYFSAVVKLPDNKFALYVPSYCNTFGVEENENNISTFLFNMTEDKHLFINESKDIASFKFLNADVINFAISFALALQKNVLLSPLEFGTIKAIRPSISTDSEYLPIGRITSNGSVKSKMLLKDAELPEDKESFMLYMKFNRKIDVEDLRFISSIIFESDLNVCPLLKNSELLFTNDGKLYFNIEHID